MGSNKPTDCHATMVVEAAIETILDMWSERVALGRDDRSPSEEGPLDAADIEAEEYNAGRLQCVETKF